MEYRSLGEIADVTKLAGFEFTKYVNYIPDGEIIAIRALNLKSGRLALDDVKRISAKVSKELPRSQLHKYDIVLSYTGTVGEAAQIMVDNQYHLAPNVAKVTPDVSVVNPVYLFQYINSYEFRQQMLNYAHGSTQKTVPMKVIRELKIPLSNMDTQNAIASVLDTLDKKVTLNTQINDNLQQQAKTLFAEMFPSVGNIEMANGVLSDIAHITMGQSPSGKSYNEVGIGTVFFQGRAEFGFRFPEIRLFTTEPKRMATRGDTLISVRAPVGDLNVAHENCCIGRGLSAIHSKYGYSSFILYMMFSLHTQLDVFNGQGTVFGSINKDALNKMPVFIPETSEIERFENIVSPIDHMILKNHDEIIYLTALRDTLLPRLMSGELDMSGLDF